MKYIVNLGNSFLADWEGDPGRTLLTENAQKFNSNAEAQKALKKAISKNPHRKLKGSVEPYKQ